MIEGERVQGFVVTRLCEGEKEFVATESVSPYANLTLLRARMFDQQDPDWATENPIHRLMRCVLEIGAAVPKHEWEEF